MTARQGLPPIVALAGGVGAARFLDGLVRVVDPRRLFIIVNTADDAEIHGLHVSPDLDTVTYTLAGLADRQRGWGIARDTLHCSGALGRLGAETWFQLGDRDLATNLYRTERLQRGVTLSEVTRQIRFALRVKSPIVPMSDDAVRTRVRTPRGELDFQTWFVERRTRDRVLGVRFAGIRQARPAPGVLDAARRAAAIILCPSNPVISIGPILAVPGIRAALRRTRAPVVAVSPIVAGRALKGPAARMMKTLGMEVSALGVARLYRDFVDVFVIDRLDARLATRIAALGKKVVVTNTIMTGTAQRKALARTTLRAVGLL